MTEQQAMYTLQEIYTTFLNRDPGQSAIGCIRVDRRHAEISNRLTSAATYYAFTLVTSGRIELRLNDRLTSYGPNDVIVYVPGLVMTVERVSDDYAGICLMAEETLTYDIPFVREMLMTVCFPRTNYGAGKISLSDAQARRISGRMAEISEYLDSDHVFKDECLSSLYALTLLDLYNMHVGSHAADVSFSRGEKLYFDFLALLPDNFAGHRDVGFYATKLAVTGIYLSRVVKKYSGLTVRHHIDRLLAMEAAYQLRRTDLPLFAISERLGFASPSGFCRFFCRMKGVAPRDYRASGRYSSLKTGAPDAMSE